MAEADTGQNRRKYPRFKAPLCYRRVNYFLRKPLVNVSLSGMRIYSEDILKIGKHLELELILPDDTILTCVVKVVWQNPLPEGAEAKYDVGLQFINVPEDKLQLLSQMLEKYAEPVNE